MTGPGWPPALTAGSADVLRSVLAGLGWLSAAPMAGRPTAELADCLRGLEQAESMLTAARTSVLAAFTTQDGCADDGHGSARTWLTWQTRVTHGAASGAVGWLRRFAAHPDVGKALAAGEISASWARQMCAWTDRLPEERRGDADTILPGAARGGADLRGLAGLAEEMLRRCARPDTDGDDRFSDRGLVLDHTIGGAGRLLGDLTAGCAAALSSVLAALGAKAGPDDDRTRAQRDHDALQEACRRLLGAGCLPDRAGQPAQVRLHMTLDQLRGLPGAPEAEAAWAAAGWAGVEPGDSCDAQIAPQVDGHVDPQALDRLTTAWLDRLPARVSHSASHCAPGSGTPPESGTPPGSGTPASGTPTESQTPPAVSTPPAACMSPEPDLPPASRARLARSLLGLAADALSGPSGLAAWLRTGLLSGQAASASLPLDLGRPTEIIPPQLRRAVISRDTRCAFPGCDQVPQACQVHHLVPRSEGGVTALQNLILLCSFHHLIAVHRWGWHLTLHSDGTVTARGPDGRVLRDTGPPATAA